MTDTASEPVVATRPWSEMTPIEQAHHLVHDHAFDHNYFVRERHAHAHLVDDGAVTEAWVNGPLLDGEESFPSAGGRNDWHDGDHEGQDAYPNHVTPGGRKDRPKHVHRTPLHELQFRFPLTTAVAVNHGHEGDEYTDGWVVGYADNALIVRRDVDNAEVTIALGVNRVSVAAGPVTTRWEAVSRLPFPDSGFSEGHWSEAQKIEWLLRDVTHEFADPSQREDDLRTLAEIITRTFPVTHLGKRTA